MQLPEMEVDGKTEIKPADTEIEVDVYDDGSKIILNKTKGTEKIKIKSGKQKPKKPYSKIAVLKKEGNIKKQPKLTKETQNKFEEFLKKKELPKPYAVVVPQAEHPSVHFREITTSSNQQFKDEFKEKAIKNQKAIKNIQNSINSETKQLIKEVEFIKQTPRHPRD